MSKIVTNGSLRGSGSEMTLGPKQRPVLRGTKPNDDMPTMARFVSGKGAGPWLSEIPFHFHSADGSPPVIKTDGKRCFVFERRSPQFSKPVSGSRAEPMESEDVCIPAEILDVFADPFSNPFNLGDTINCAADVIGTEPFTYDWNAGSGSGPTFSVVVSDDNIEGKDETGLGHITVTLLLKNACNEVGDFVSGTFAAQGTPPP